MRWLLLWLSLGLVAPASAGELPDYVAACKLAAGGSIVASKLAYSDGVPLVYLDWLDPQWSEPSVLTCEFDTSTVPQLSRVWVTPPCDCNIMTFDEATLDAANEQLRNAAAE